VVQRINPIGKSQMAGREENILEMCSKGGNGKLIEKRSGTRRGFNKLSQLFQ